MATTYTSVLEWDDGQELRITRYDSWLGRRLVYFFSWDAMYATDDLNVSVGTLRPSAHRRHQAQRARFQRHQARAGFRGYSENRVENVLCNAATDRK